MRAPSAAKSSAISRPMPLPAPVTTATRSVRSTSSSCSSSGDGDASSIAHVEATRAATATWEITGARHGGDHRLRPRPFARVLLRPARPRAPLAAALRGARGRARSSASRRRPGSTSRCCGSPAATVEVELLEYRGLDDRSRAPTPPSRPRHGSLLRLRATTSTRSTTISPRRASASARTARSRCRTGAEQGRQEPLLARSRRLRLRVPRAPASRCRQPDAATRGGAPTRRGRRSPSSTGGCA